jgi:tRNA U34 5-methylaminomethyl-2-thiouridine-forming methyltransferase MnmC
LAATDKNQLILKPGEFFSLKREVRITDDGSSTIFIPALNENYHSTHGAIQESMHVFIEAGLNQNNSQSINIFEVGFGTGLNCVLTHVYSRGRKILYNAIEKFPVDNDLLNQLNYGEIADKTFFQILHQSPWDIEMEAAPGFIMRKITGDISEFNPDIKYNLIYFDAFAPEVQPELWTPVIFEKMYNMLDPGGILTTYCAKGEVRRTMQKCGFKVERLPGPPGKREMLRASKSGIENIEF